MRSVASVIRCIAVLLVVLATAPASALGVSRVQFDEFDDGTRVTRLISIVDQAGDPDAITIATEGGQHVIRSTGNGLTAFPGNCDGDGTDVPVITCPLSTSFSVTLAGGDDALTIGNAGVPVAADLGEGADTLAAAGATAPVSVAGGPNNDILEGGAAADVLAGGDGNDTLTGLGGIDDYFGEAGDDTVEARDGAAERIACGAGTDQARNDFTDIIAECERGIDGDADGFSSAVDCNDAAPRIFPGSPEVFENGVDEDCDGRDNPNLDRDGDGFPRPVDCDDSQAGVRPNAVERPGNAIDENCDLRADPFAQLAAVVTNQWAVSGAVTRLQTLVLRNAPAGARVTLTCAGRGCPIKRPRRRTVGRDLARVVLHAGFRRARLRPGARLTLAVRADGTIGRTYVFTVKRNALPVSRISCRAPGASRSEPC